MIALLLIAILISPTPLLSLMVWVGFKGSPSKWRVLLPIFFICLFVASYCIEPYATNDITRYWTMIDNSRGLSLSEAIQMYNDGLFTENVLFWAFGQLGDPRILTALSGACVYTIAAYINCDSCNRNSCNYVIPYVLIIQFLTLPFYSIVNNVRNVNAFSFILLAAYRDFVKGKRDLITFFLYIAPVFMHKTGIVLLLIRIMVPIFKKFYALSIVLIAALSSLISFTYNNIDRIRIGGAIGSLIQKLIRSAYRYMTVETTYSINVQNSGVQRLLRMLVFGITITIIVMLVYFMTKMKEYSKYENMAVFCFFICIVTLSCNLFDVPAYWRFSCASIIGFTPIMVLLMKEFKGLHRVIKYCMGVFILLSMMKFALNALLELRRLEGIDFAVNIMLTNVALILLKLIRYAFTGIIQ